MKTDEYVSMAKSILYTSEGLKSSPEDLTFLSLVLGYSPIDIHRLWHPILESVERCCQIQAKGPPMAHPNVLEAFSSFVKICDLLVKVPHVNETIDLSEDQLKKYLNSYYPQVRIVGAYVYFLAKRDANVFFKRWCDSVPVVVRESLRLNEFESHPSVVLRALSETKWFASLVYYPLPEKAHGKKRFGFRKVLQKFRNAFR